MKYESNCSEFTISKKKQICFSFYKPASTGIIITLFEEMSEVISKALCKYENEIEFCEIFKNTS